MTTFKYPFEALNGSLVLTSDELKKIPEVIKHVLQTQFEERVMNVEFGVAAAEFNTMYDLPKFLRSLESSLEIVLAVYGEVSIRLVGYAEDSGEIPITCYWDVDEDFGTVEVTL
jgi:hypothetical protein